MSKEDKRQNIIQAAYKVFAQKGYTNASIKDIANEANITPGLIHYYFSTKQEILFHVQNQVQERYHQNYEQQENISLSPTDAFQEIKSRAINDSDWYKLRYEIFSLGMKNNDLKEEVASILRNGRESLSVPLKKMKEKTVSTEEIASILLACFDGLALQKIVDDNFNIDDAYTVLEELLKIYLEK